MNQSGIDTRMKFSIEPPSCLGENAFDQWKDAMRAVARLPLGIPSEFRKKVWLSLADNHISELKVDWEKTVRFTFNERSNPDDDKLGLQIVKDLHRTGCTNFSGHDNDEERAVLKRVLLAYARWNKRVGYCQGFNVIAALLLDVMNRKEDDALKVMIYLIDHVLPESYFTNNLRALSVDMAVFRDLLEITLPTLSHHLHHLQHAAQDVTTGACYEPPLTNVFTMQWFLTLFATCLPKNIVLRVWDSIFLEGSEVLLRTALTIWGKLSKRIMAVASADEFYTLMGDLSAEMMDGRMFNGDSVIKSIYSLSPFPFPQIKELREKYTYNIRPFTNTASSGKKSSRTSKNILYSDEDELDDEDIEAMTCFPGFIPLQMRRGGDGEGATGSAADISVLGPGVYGAVSDGVTSAQSEAVYMERMSTDITALQKQYEKLRQRQTQAHIIISAATARTVIQKPKAKALVPKIETPLAMNHLFVGKHYSGGRNRLIAEGPRIVSTFPRSSHFTKHLQALDRASSKLNKNRASSCKPSVKSKTPSDPETDKDVVEKRESEDVNKEKEPQESPTSGKHQDVQETPDKTGLSESQDKSGLRESQDKIGLSESQDKTGLGESQDKSGLGESQDKTGLGESQDKTGLGESQDTSTLKGSDMDSESRQMADCSVINLKDIHKTECCNSVHLVVCENSKESSESSRDSLCDTCGNEISCEKSNSGEKEQKNILKTSEDNKTDQLLSSPSAQQNDSNSNSCAILDKNSASLVSESVERIPCLEESDSIVLSSNKEVSEETTQTEKRKVSKFGPDVPQGRSFDSDYEPSPSPSPRWTMSVSNTEKNDSKMITKFVYIASKQSNNRNNIGSPLSSTATSPTSPKMLSPTKSNKPFYPFPVKHVNRNRAKNGLKLGLYDPSTVQLADASKPKQGNSFFKPRNGLS